MTFRKDIWAIDQALDGLAGEVHQTIITSPWLLSGRLIQFYEACRDGFEATGDDKYWDRFITILGSTPQPDPEEVDDDQARGEWAHLNGCLAHRLFQRDRGYTNLENANIAAYRAVRFAVGNLAAFPPLGALWITVLQRLAITSGALTELLEAEEFLSELITSTPDILELRSLIGGTWSALGVIQRCIYGVNKHALDALDRAVVSHGKALRLTATDDALDTRLERAVNLAIALRYRYQEKGNASDFQMALSALDDARAIVGLSPSELARVEQRVSRLHVVAAGRLAAGSAARAEHRRLAATHARRALTLGGHDPLMRLELEMQALWTSVAAGEDANPDIVRNVARQLTQTHVAELLDLLTSDYQSADNPEVFDAALAVMEIATLLTPAGSADHAEFLRSQGVLAIRAGAGLSQTERNTRAGQFLTKALHQPGARATTRVLAGVLLGWIHQVRRNWADAADALEPAVDALASFKEPETNLEQQLRRITSASGSLRVGPVGLLSTAVTCAVQAGNPKRGLRMLEKGMTALFCTRTDLPDIGVLAARGPIVAVVGGFHSGHAIIVTSDVVEAIEIPAQADALEQLGTLVQAVSGNRLETQISGVLEWLWAKVAGPVFDHLSKSAHRPDRIWWWPLGPYAFLPLHAAGLHRQQPGETVMDRCISSYLTSLGSLHERRMQTLERPGFHTALAVACPGYPYLPAVNNEAEKVAKILGTESLLKDDAATVANVLMRSRGAGLIHFACHGYVDPTRPSRSHLELSDGPLTVDHLVGSHPGDTWLAYLSACWAATPSFQLDEQPVHVASAFQQVGYRHVIGTLWPIRDDPTPAELFYQHLLTADPASALRQTTLDLRDKHRQKPSRWAALVHFGPEC